MQNCNLISPFFSQNLCLNTFTQISTYQQLVALTSSLQQILAKQQVILNNMVAKQQQLEKKVKLALTTKDKDVQIESNEKSVSLQSELSEKNETEFDEKLYSNEKKKPRIMRRNGFKRKTRKSSSEDYEEESSFESESLSDVEGSCRVRRNASKAKHLWVNYGRRIIDYVVSQTEGEVQMRAKQLIGKLNSKKDFERIFGFLREDSEEERNFKSSIGRLAIDFVKRKSGPSFEGAKYKDDMLAQKHVVAAWIERLISTENSIKL